MSSESDESGVPNGALLNNTAKSVKGVNKIRNTFQTGSSVIDSGNRQSGNIVDLTGNAMVSVPILQSPDFQRTKAQHKAKISELSRRIRELEKLKRSSVDHLNLLRVDAGLYPGNSDEETDDDSLAREPPLVTPVVTQRSYFHNNFSFQQARLTGGSSKLLAPNNVTQGPSGNAKRRLNFITPKVKSPKLAVSQSAASIAVTKQIYPLPNSTWVPPVNVQIKKSPTKLLASPIKKPCEREHPISLKRFEYSFAVKCNVEGCVGTIKRNCIHYGPPRKTTPVRKRHTKQKKSRYGLGGKIR